MALFGTVKRRFRCPIVVTAFDAENFLVLPAVEGNPDVIKTVNDVWKFSKNMWSQNPTWYLVETSNK